MQSTPIKDQPSLQHRRFVDLPLQTFIDEVAKHLSETGEPETMTDLYRLKISKDEPFRIVTSVTAPRYKRADGKLAPCPMCQPNKFVEGSLVFLPKLEACAEIGHCCANKENMDAALLDLKERQEERANLTNDNYLLDTIPRITDRIAAINDAMRQAELARAFYRDFRLTAQSVFNQLRLSRKNGGMLVVSEQLVSSQSDGPRGLRTSGSTVDTRDLVFGRLDGSTIAKTNYNPVKELTAILDMIMPYQFLGDDSELLDFVEELSIEKRRRAGVELRASEKLYQQFIVNLSDFREFFTSENFARMAAWGDHKDAPFPFRCRIMATPSGGRQVNFDWWGGRFRRELPATLWALRPAEAFAVAA